MSRSKSRPHRREEPVTPTRDWPVAGLSAAGLLIGAYLAWTKVSAGSALFCEAGSGCDIVQASRYATFLGLPTALWGAGLYALVGGIALTGLSARRWLAAFLLAVAGAAFSVYLTVLSVFVIDAVCLYCLVSAAIVLALVALLFIRRPPITGRRSPLRPSRVVPLAALTAVATVVIGAGVFAWRSPGETAAYAEGLARHLTARGDVMYGAYW